MSVPPTANRGFAYLFERFPTFTQTFCVRETAALTALVGEFPIYSIRRPSGEPPQDCFGAVHDPVYLPDKFDVILASEQGFRRAARKAQETLRAEWGDDGQKYRIYEALWLGPQLREAGIEHVHVHFAGIAARTAFWLHRLFGIRYSITAHANDIFCEEENSHLTPVLTEAAFVATVSDFSLCFLREKFPDIASRCHRLYNGISLDRFTPSPMSEGRPLLVSVGRYIEKKGFDQLIDACAGLGDRDFACQIVGQGPLESELRAQAERLGLSGKVEITGPKAEGEIRDLLAAARVFALPCVSTEGGSMDNLPTVIMEAMASGLPVVSCPVAGVPEMVVDGTTGFLVPEKNPALMAEALAKLLDDPTLAARMGAAGLERCRDLFDLARTADALQKLLHHYGAFRSAA